MSISLASRYTLPPPRVWSLPMPAPDYQPPAPLVASLRNTDELAQLVVNYSAKHFPAYAIAERKHDGVRALWIDGQLRTRGGMILWNTAHLWPALQWLEAALGGPHFIDMELDEQGGFATVARHTSRAIWERGPVPGRGHVWIWDAVPMDEWRYGAPEGLSLVERKRRLRSALSKVADPALRFVEHRRVTSDNQLQRLAADVYAEGGEGLVVKDGRARHHPGRSRYWQRIKCKLSLDLRVIGYSESKTIPGTLGAIVVDHEGVGVRVHAGFTARELAKAWHYPERLIGRIAEIEAMEATELGSLRSPRFLQWRDDMIKGEAR